MANIDLHPYGHGGELPEGIGLVNNLNDGGINKALTAEMGKTLKDALNGVEIPFDQAYYYTFENDALVKNTGNVTQYCSTEKLAISDYKSILFTGGMNKYRGYFCAVFFNDNDEFVGRKLVGYEKIEDGTAEACSYDMVDALGEIPDGATKLVLQTNKQVYTNSSVVAFLDTPYNSVTLDKYWRQEYYGVKGDGIHDDTNALKLLIANTIGELDFKGGVYKISNSLFINTRYITKINGNGATFLVDGDISAFIIRGYSTGYNPPVNDVFPALNVSTPGFLITNVRITSTNPKQGTGIEVQNTYAPMIDHCFIYKIGHGIRIGAGYQHDPIISNNFLWCIYGNGVWFDSTSGSHQVNIIGNIIRYCHMCIYINPKQTANVQITGNDIETSIYPADETGHPQSESRCIVFENGNTDFSSEIEIVGNTIQGHSTALNTGVIDLLGTSSMQITDVSIVGNQINGSKGNGITLSYVDNVSISGNTYKGFTNSAIRMKDSVRRVAITGEAITGSFISCDQNADVKNVSVTGCVGTNATTSIGGSTLDYISVVGNNFGGGSVSVGTATHKQVENNI